VQFRILGPVEATAPDGRVVAVRGQPLRLLGLLLVRRGEPVGADSAIDALWGEGLPANPANALQVVVSRLRAAVGAEAIAWNGGGYTLALEGPEAVDADRFARLADEGAAALGRADPVAAADALHAAMALWRGPVLHELRYESFAVGAVARLEEMRLACLECRLEADLALGRHEDVLGELAALVAEHPLREPLRLQLVRALESSGRRAEALEAARGARRALADELGLAPSPQLVALLGGVERERPLPARRQVVCVAADVRCAESVGTLDPEVREEVMRCCSDEAETVLRRHGDPVVERLPDGLVAVFGTRASHEDDALRAVRAATALQRRIGELQWAAVPLDVRLGVTAGIALVTGHDALPSGDVVGAASRLAREADVGELRLGEPVQALVDAIRTRRADATALAGRQRELAALDAAVARVRRAGRVELMTLAGEAGIGKSRLVRELARHAAADAQVLIGHCPAYGDGVTYWPLREMVLQALKGRTLSSVMPATDDGRAAAATIAAVLGLGGVASADAAPWAFRMLLTTLAAERALVLAFEDAHWAEPALLDLIDQLAGGPLTAPVLLLCVGRPELLDARPAWTAGTVLRPAPLDEEASRRLLSARAPLSEPALARVVARARGNPLFLEQLAAHVRERSEDSSLPPALHALLAARLDALDPAQRRLIEAGAIEGETFHVGGLEALVPALGGPETQAALDALSRRELVRPAFPFIAGERAFRFGHALVRDAAYEAMALATRADAHERLAGWLVDLGDAVPDASARIGTQLERAHAAASELRAPAARLEALAHAAARRLAEAAEKVHRRGDLPSEIAFLERALALLAPSDPARAELLPAMGTALFEVSSLERAERVADEAAASSIDRVRLRGEVERARMAAYRHPESVDPAAGLAVAEEAAVALEALGDDIGVARARCLMCELAWMQGASERGLAEARTALRFARRDPAGTVDLDATVSVIAWALVVNRVPVARARAECVELLALVAGHRFAELGVRGFVAVLDAMAGDFARARAQLLRSREGLQELGLRQASIWMAVFDAEVRLLAGDPVSAGEALDDAARVAGEIGDRLFLATIRVERAHVLLAQDRLPEAAEAVARIDEGLAPNDLEWRVKRLTARGRLAAREGRAEEALAEARAAVALADSSDMFIYRADAWRDLAEVAERVGEAGEAAAARATALRLYRAKGNVAAARQLARFARRGRQVEPVDR
jgi:DNA-binding SARP family transcriptional activator/tetratricopeptide (TPR) repeat protein